MPESYLHVRCAKNACLRSSLPEYDVAAAMAGAAGPDIFFYYMGLPPLARLGQRMHTEGCGALLTALAEGAHTPTTRGYALGFLSHNAVDATLHPWIVAGRKAHALLEQELDSAYLLRDKGRAKVRAEDCVPRLRPERAREIGVLLGRCIDRVYGLAVSPMAVAKAFRDMYRAKDWLRDEKGRKGSAAKRAERALGLKPGFLSGHLISGTPMFLSPEVTQRVDRAEDLAAQMMAAAASRWRGEIGPLELSRRLGSRNYLTGEET